MPADRLNEILDAVPLAMVYVGPDERVRAANTMATTLFGFDLVGRNYVSVLRQPALIECIDRSLKQSRKSDAIYLTSQAAREVTYQVRAVPHSGNEGPGVLISFEDISPMQEAEQMRRDFVANVSHELRSPLTALLAFIETLHGAAKDDPEARDRFLSIMQREAERMNRLVHDLLSLSRVQAEERVRPKQETNVASTLKTAVQSLQATAQKDGVEILVDAQDKSASVLGDGDQLVQIFSNLLENAVKYGAKPGTIVASTTKIEHDPTLRRPAVRIDVKDDGPGIDARHVPRLTERFYRVDGHRSRELGGTGLGLAIVKHIVSRHRGHLRITSEKGKGSCFSVTLPTL